MQPHFVHILVLRAIQPKEWDKQICPKTESNKYSRDRYGPWWSLLREYNGNFLKNQWEIDTWQDAILPSKVVLETIIIAWWSSATSNDIY